jgi:hypothetical protein
MVFVWKRAQVIAAGIKGRRKAAMATYATRSRPITLARVLWLERPIIPVKDKRETLGAEYRAEQPAGQPEHKTAQSPIVGMVRWLLYCLNLPREIACYGCT